MRTRVGDLLGIDVPIIQASLGPWTSVELSAAVSNAGGLGTIGTVLMSAERVVELIGRMRQLTDRPFAVNYSARGPFDPQSFEATLDARPAAISFAHGILEICRGVPTRSVFASSRWSTPFTRPAGPPSREWTR